MVVVDVAEFGLQSGARDATVNAVSKPSLNKTDTVVALYVHLEDIK